MVAALRTAIEAIDRSRLETELQMARDQSASRARIMAAAGHDLLQPLQAAVLIIDRTKPGVDEAASAELEHALELLEHLGDALRQLAKASRSGPDEQPRLAIVPIDAFLRDEIPQWQEHASARGVELRVVHSKHQVISDRAMLSTIIGNLVSNALKYTPRGRGVLVGCRRQDGVLSLQVFDQGPGVARDKLAPIFEEFLRIDPADGQGGLGRGLSIVRRTACILRHRLDVRTEPGRGCCFSVGMPLAAADPSSLH